MSKRQAVTHQEHWLALSKRVARKVNLAWWLETSSPPLLIAAVLCSAGLLVVRNEFPRVAPEVLLGSVGAIIVLLALACLVIAARRFEAASQSLVRIEAAMELNNSLSAANAGVGSWPLPVARVDAGLAWQWSRLVVAPLGALILLAAGMLIPVKTPSPAEAPPTEQPQVWKRLSIELDRLAAEKVVDEKYLEEVRRKLGDLKAENEDRWFSHASLEATDSLKKSHRAETERVARELGRAERALGDLQKNAAASNEAEKNRSLEEFDQALQGLRNGAMKPHSELLDQMKQLDSKDLSKMGSEQMQQLQETMKKNAQAMKDAKGGGEDWSEELLAGDGEGEESEEEEGSGQGGWKRGPGHDPKLLGKERNRADIGNLTGLEAKDLSRATPGDLLELRDGEHEVNQSPSVMTTGGATEATGKGGDRVWRDSLDPAEQRALKNFFE